MSGSERFFCPMDAYEQDGPGKCPRCGMDLKQKAKAKADYVEDPGAMMLEHPNMYKWVQAAVVILGLWLVTSPLTFDYRSRGLVWSDVLSGAAAILIAGLALAWPKKAWLSYANALVGLWLLFAPLVFWAPAPASYVTDTLVGSLLIAFAFVIPMSMEMPGPEVPPGWSYNPSTWVQRAPIVALGLIGFLLARPMAAYQLKHVAWVWEPFFGEGTLRILTSEVSRSWPVSDAGLGAMTYIVELLSTLMGDQRRWRTMPWMVAIFGLAVIPLGVTSIVLVIMQPLMVGHWCTLCLITAAAMLLMVPLALDEVVAMIQFLNQSRKRGKSLWRTFWHGGNLPEARREPEAARRPAWRPSAMLWGVTGSWSLYLSTALGVWLMFAPAVFGTEGRAADSDHLTGALIVTFAMIALAEVGRAARLLNLPLGVWLLAAPWLLEGASGAARWSSALAGLAVVALSAPLGRIRDSYGTFDPWVVWPRKSLPPPMPRRREAVSR